MIYRGIPLRHERGTVRHHYLQWLPQERIFRIRSPKKTTEEEFQLLLEKKYPWMKRVYDDVTSALAEAKPERKIVGQPLEEGLSSDPILLEKRQRALLSQAIRERLPALCERVGVDPCDVRIRRMKTRWGSCNPRARRIWVSLMMAERSLEDLDYILLHELTHLLEASHNARFYQLLERSCPNWKSLQQGMKRPR